MKRSSFRLIAVTGIVLIAMFALTRGALATVYSFTTLDDPSGVAGTTQASGINDNKEIVGYYTDTNGAYHGFAYLNGTFDRINDPSAGTARDQGTKPCDINDYGEIVGVYIDSSGNHHGFEYSSASRTYTTSNYISAIYGTVTGAAGIDDNGDIVGSFTASGGEKYGFQYTTIPGVTEFYTIDRSGADSTYAYDINDSGDVVGIYMDSSGNPHGFKLSGGDYTSLDTISAPYGTVAGATGINDNDDIVGIYTDSNDNVHGFMYSPDSFTTIDDPNGVDGTFAMGISDNGVVVGGYQDGSGGTHGFIATPQPLWQNATCTEGGWYYSTWFGFFNASYAPWIDHSTLGWLYPFGTSTSSIWFYDSSMKAFLWTSATVYPYFYRAKDRAWLWYNEGTSNPCWFYNFKTRSWEKH